jgi:hypothetical protein
MARNRKSSGGQSPHFKVQNSMTECFHQQQANNLRVFIDQKLTERFRGWPGLDIGRGSLNLTLRLLRPTFGLPFSIH